jgi:HEAT repeat protein
MDELQRLTTYLRSFGSAPPTVTGRAEIATALHHKWQGIQATAATVLATWGDRTSVELLKQWLLYGLQQEQWRSIRRVAMQSLAQCAGSEDVDWLIDLMAAQSKWLIKHEFVPLLAALPAQPTGTRLRVLLHDRDWHNRQIAVIAISRRSDPQRQHLLQEALHDEHPTVRTAARFGLAKA